MSYIRNVSAGKKVTVNVAEIPPSGNADGYFGNSLVVNPMPAQNITRDILLSVLKFNVHLNVVYGSNTVNPGQAVPSYEAYVQSTDGNNKIEINGQRRMFINVQNDVCPDFTLYSRNLYCTIGTPNDSVVGTTDSDFTQIVKYTTIIKISENPTNIIENASPTLSPINITIPLYKRILCDIYYKYVDNGVTKFAYCKKAYCTELGDIPTTQSQQVQTKMWLIKGYTYVFEFEVDGNTITKSYYVNPNLDEQVLIHFEY